MGTLELLDEEDDAAESTATSLTRVERARVDSENEK